MSGRDRGSGKECICTTNISDVTGRGAEELWKAVTSKGGAAHRPEF